MIKIVTGLFIIAILASCSVKEFNAGADSITNDIRMLLKIVKIPLVSKTPS